MSNVKLLSRKAQIEYYKKEIKKLLKKGEAVYIEKGIGDKLM